MNARKVLVIGSGPIVIGQAAEFDYAGTQACRALREEGVETVLVNSNPATIMTDPGVADRTYIEPLTAEYLELVIARERPDSLLAGLGGQTGLNLAIELADAGVLDRYGVAVLGAPIASIRAAEDRERFKLLMLSIGEPVADSVVAHTADEALAFAERVGLPLIARPAFTLGGTGGGAAWTMGELRTIVTAGIAASPVGQVLVERSLLGWKEIEYEVMRDTADTCITICNMENIDAMGVHTGDSIVVAPSQTLSDREYQMLRSASLKIIRALGIVGGCNVQFALDPTSSRYAVVEVNPRVSRSSALASKATGYPIARVTAKVALGKRLEDIPNAVTGRTSAAFEPALDYLVVKIPRWPFDKFPHGARGLGTQMRSTGEAMAIDRCFEGALQKAVRSLDLGGRDLLWEDPAWDDPAERARHVSEPTDLRLWALTASLRRSADPATLAAASGIDRFFIERLGSIIEMERALLRAETLEPVLVRGAKRIGFSDRQIAALTDRTAERVRALRISWGIRPTYKMVDTCAAEFEAATPYFYSTYESENEAEPLPGRSVVVIGSGPIRIGQGIEFDYCSVRAAAALREHGVNSIMVNSNPETVSTDFDASTRLYFEPLDEESVRDVLENECAPGAGPAEMPGVLVQFGGQTAIALAGPLADAGHAILGSAVDAIDLAEDRDRFADIVARLGIAQPPGAIVASAEDAVRAATVLGYPVIVRPSYVLGGRAMEICRDEDELRAFAAAAKIVAGIRPLLVDKYLEGLEIEVDAVADGDEVLIPGIMQHVERAGVHSGDSIALYPAPDLGPRHVERIVADTTAIARALQIKGLFNIQFVIHGDAVYVLEVNPRASRTVPFLSKVTGIPLVDVAIGVALGQRLSDLPWGTGLARVPDGFVAAKAPVFSMSKLGRVDTRLGPEMRSTGEVMGIGRTAAEAIGKALLAAGQSVPPTSRPGAALVSLDAGPSGEADGLVGRLAAAGFRLFASATAAARVRGLGLAVDELAEDDIVGAIQAGSLDLVLSTGSEGLAIRRAAAERRIPSFSSLDTLGALLSSREARVTPRALTVDEHRRGVTPSEPVATAAD